MVRMSVRKNYNSMVVCGLCFGGISDENTFFLSSELSQHSMSPVQLNKCRRGLSHYF